MKCVACAKTLPRSCYVVNTDFCILEGHFFHKSCYPGGVETSLAICLVCNRQGQGFTEKNLNAAMVLAPENGSLLSLQTYGSSSQEEGDDPGSESGSAVQSSAVEGREQGGTTAVVENIDTTPATNEEEISGCCPVQTELVKSFEPSETSTATNGAEISNVSTEIKGDSSNDFSPGTSRPRKRVFTFQKCARPVKPTEKFGPVSNKNPGQLDIQSDASRIDHLETSVGVSSSNSTHSVNRRNSADNSKMGASAKPGENSLAGENITSVAFVPVKPVDNLPSKPHSTSGDNIQRIERAKQGEHSMLDKSGDSRNPAQPNDCLPSTNHSKPNESSCNVQDSSDNLQPEIFPDTSLSSNNFHSGDAASLGEIWVPKVLFLRETQSRLGEEAV